MRREKKKKDREENEVIGLSKKPQSRASKRGREGGGRVLYLFQCSIRFSLFFFLQLSQLFPHMLLWFECRVGKKSRFSIFLFFIFHSAFQICPPPALEKTYGAAHQEILDFFLYFEMFILLC